MRAVGGGVEFRGHHDHRLFRQRGAERREFVLDNFEIAHGIAIVRIARVHEMRDQPRALDVLQEAMPSPTPSCAPSIKPGKSATTNVRPLPGAASGIGGNHAQMRLERGERIRRNLRTRRGDARNQRGFSRVRKTDQAHIRQQFQFEPQMALFAGTCLLHARAAPGATAARNAGLPLPRPPRPPRAAQKSLARLGKIEKLLAGIRVEDDGADGNLQDHVVARCAVAIRAFAVAPALGIEFAIVAVAQQGVVVRIRFE